MSSSSSSSYDFSIHSSSFFSFEDPEIDASLDHASPSSDSDNGILTCAPWSSNGSDHHQQSDFSHSSVPIAQDTFSVRDSSFEFAAHAESPSLSDESEVSMSSSLNHNFFLESIAGDDECSSDNEQLNILDELAYLSKRHHLSHLATEAFARLFVAAGHPLKSTCARTILRTNRSPLNSSSFHHFGLKSSIFSLVARAGPNLQNNGTIVLRLNIDGCCIVLMIDDCIVLIVLMNVFRSGRLVFWPILCQVISCNDTTPSIVSVHCGEQKPPSLRNFFSPMLNELKEMLINGLEIDGIRYQIELGCVICDTPARAFVKQIKGHNGYGACERCIQTGIWIGHRMTFPGQGYELRTNLSFRAGEDANHHRGLSPFEDLNLDMITAFPLDYMHLVCLGVVKLLIDYLRSPHKFSTNRVLKLSKEQIKTFNIRMISFRLNFPSEFQRKGRIIEENWKATEYMSFLLYSCPIILKDLVDPDVYQSISGYASK